MVGLSSSAHSGTKRPGDGVPKGPENGDGDGEKNEGVKMAMAGMIPINLGVAKVKLVEEVELAFVRAGEGKLGMFLA